MGRAGVHEAKEGEQTSGKTGSRQRIRMLLSGRVQGVGFRPFVTRLARSLNLTGFVRNDSRGVVLEVQGPEAVLSDFERKLVLQKPAVARIGQVLRKRTALVGHETEFHVHSPEGDPGGEGDFASLLPDTAVCADCISELFDPANRRYRYPLISCTGCGPRFSIVLEPPFDRCRTTLRTFPLCRECRREFTDPEDRRFHSQTIGCPLCGPRTRFLGRGGREQSPGDPLRRTLDLLLGGAVVAIKGIGGYHLACDARNREAVGRIRSLKNRPEKPLAVMVGSFTGIGKVARVSPRARRELGSPGRPIVLLPKGDEGSFPFDLVAPDLDRMGLFLPVTPIQHLLFGPAPGNPLALVMTSANPEGGPIAIDEGEVLLHFSGKIDGFLVHDRPIRYRLDDSLVLPGDKGPVLLRRSRGWVPSAFSVFGGPRPGKRRVVLALGGQLKTAPCQVKDGKALVLPHMGDLDREGVRESFRSFLEDFLATQGSRPTHLACDMHPDFATTLLAHEWGKEWGIPVSTIQHHHAHIASVMADRGVPGPVLGLALDGYGWGTDGTPWGGELLRVDRDGCRRLGHLRTFPLAGGDRASREPWRMGTAALQALGRGEEACRIFRSPAVPELLRLLERPGPPLFPATSSAGRLIDAAYALLGGKERLSFEGQGAMEMEGWARRAAGSRREGFRGGTEERGYVLSEEGVLDFLPLLGELACEKDRERGALHVHRTLASGLRDWVLRAGERTGLRTVVLSGGVFQNRVLADLLRSRLRESGFRVLEPGRVPANDGGLALGQAWVVWSGILSGGGKNDRLNHGKGF